jgi:hypothetical protein
LAFFGKRFDAPYTPDRHSNDDDLWEQDHEKVNEAIPHDLVPEQVAGAYENQWVDVSNQERQRADSWRQQ